MELHSSRVGRATKIVVLTLANDKNAFTNPIVNSFVYYLNQAKEHCDFWILPYTMDPFGSTGSTVGNSYVAKIADINPDVIVIGDDKLHKLFYERISKASRAHVVTFFSNFERDEINLSNNQSALINNYPVKTIIQTVKKMVKLEKIAILGNPWSDKNVSKIKNELAGLIELQIFRESTWRSWTARLKEIESKFDAVWLFLPYGVVDDAGKQVDFQMVGSEIRSLRIPTLGFGQTNGPIKRTITAGMSQDSIGRSLASIVLRYIVENKRSEEEYCAFELYLNHLDFARLGMSIPEDLAHQISL